MPIDLACGCVSSLLRGLHEYRPTVTTHMEQEHLISLRWGPLRHRMVLAVYMRASILMYTIRVSPARLLIRVPLLQQMPPILMNCILLLLRC